MFYKQYTFVGDQFVDQSSWLPRRSGVSFPDLVFMLWPLALAFQHEGLVQVYFCIAFLMFAVSALHHWLPQETWHDVLDRVLIFWLIAGTPLPYLEAIMTQQIFAMSYMLCVVASISGAVCLVLWRVILGRMLSEYVYAPAFVLGAISLLGVDLPAEYLHTWLWFGVAMYFLNGLISHFSWPNTKWFRTLQHLCLYAAFAAHQHSAAAMSSVLS